MQEHPSLGYYSRFGKLGSSRPFRPVVGLILKIIGAALVIIASLCLADIRKLLDVGHPLSPVVELSKLWWPKTILPSTHQGLTYSDPLLLITHIDPSTHTLVRPDAFWLRQVSFRSHVSLPFVHPPAKVRAFQLIGSKKKTPHWVRASPASMVNLTVIANKTDLYHYTKTVRVVHLTGPDLYNSIEE
jgi:hypothetical protein